MRYLNIAGHLKACGCKFTEKRGQASVHSTPVPSLHRNEKPPPGWQYMGTVIPKLKPLSSSENPKLSQRTHKLSLWYLVMYLQQISGKLQIWEEEKRCAALYIKYLNTFAFPLSSYLTYVICFLTMWTLFEILSSPACVFTEREPCGHRWGLWTLLKGLRGRLFLLFSLEEKLHPYTSDLV